MAWTRRKFTLVAGATILLFTVTTGIVTVSSSGLSGARLKLPVGPAVPAISLGETHGLILASDGSLWSWGSDFLGWPVLGLGKLTGQTRLRRIGNETNWVSISAGDAHNLAIKSDGSLWAWGENIYGQFGFGTPGRSNAMSNIPVAAAPGYDWKQAAAGGSHTIALKSDGTLWAWGNNWAGMLGIGSTSNSATARQVGIATNWTKVWAGRLESVALQSDGSLWYWGQNLDPSLSQNTGQFLVPTRISSDTDWVDVGFGESTVFAIKSDGTLWAWGRNAHVYTGVNNHVLNATPVRVGTNNDWRTISASGWWWCQGLTKTDGSLWFMDASDSMPNGPRNPFKPVQFRRVELSKDVVAYTAGAAHAPAPGHHEPIGVVLTRDGEVWTWGMALGDYRRSLPYLASQFALRLGLKVQPLEPNPIVREALWPLPNLSPVEEKF